MLVRLKREWRRFARAPVGTRFRGQYRAYQRRHPSSSSKMWTVIGGLAIIGAGVVALPAPGPGTLIIILGATLLARESAALARALDRLEPRVRRAARWGAAVWRGAPPLGKAIAAVAGLGLVGGALLVAYSVLLR